MKRSIFAALIALSLCAPAFAQSCPAWSAWARFTCLGACASGNAAPTVVSGGNASGISRTWPGFYTLNFTVQASSATSYSCTGSNVTSSGSGSQLVITATQTAASITFQTIINAGSGSPAVFADPTLYGFIQCTGY